MVWVCLLQHHQQGTLHRFREFENGVLRPAHLVQHGPTPVRVARGAIYGESRAEALAGYGLRREGLFESGTCRPKRHGPGRLPILTGKEAYLAQDEVAVSGAARALLGK
jgi:hypothetical protein